MTYSGLIVGGTFDANGGKPSKIIATLQETLIYEIHGIQDRLALVERRLARMG